MFWRSHVELSFSQVVGRAVPATEGFSFRGFPWKGLYAGSLGFKGIVFDVFPLRGFGIQGLP